MPYTQTEELPEHVQRAIPSARGKDLFLEVVNSQLAAGEEDKVAFASAWAALENAGYGKSPEGKWVKKRGEPLVKRQIADDMFTLPSEAAARSTELGLQGKVHAHEAADGQVYFMPGATHDAYIEAYQGMLGEVISASEEKMLESPSISITIAVDISKHEDPMPETTLLKFDEDRRTVYGWASVITEKGVPVVDRQGDVIEADELLQAVDDFMGGVRKAKEMHEGEQIGEVIHSLPVTKEIAESLNLQVEREGWIVAMKIHSEDVWAKVKSGELKAFSIGGRGIREEM